LLSPPCGARPEIAEALDNDVPLTGLTRLIEDAVRGGDLVPLGQSDDVLHARVLLRPPASTAEWTARGFLPYRVKRLTAAPAEVDVLRAVFRAVRQVPELRAVPHWAASGMTVSLHHHDAVDLAEVATEQGLGPQVGARVTEACLSSLTRFLHRDPALRAAIGEQTRSPIRSFPLATRYEAAVAALSGILGKAATAGVPTWDRALLRSPDILFADPKPANFLLPRSEAGLWLRHGGPQPSRVDLDLMAYESPLSLQVVLAVFAHPLGPRDDAGALMVGVMLDTARRYAVRHGVGDDEFDTVLFYHLIRNFTSAVGQGNRGKARGFGDALERVLPRLSVGGAGLTALAESLRNWNEAAAVTATPADRGRGPSPL
jgi:hypothetical protein